MGENWETTEIPFSSGSSCGSSLPPILVPSLLILLALILLAGAELLVPGSSPLAVKLGLALLLVGLTKVALGTSMPELIVSVKAAMLGQSDIAIGNVLGSNLFNILFVLGGSAAIHPVRTTALKPLDLWMMVGVTVILLPMLFSGKRLNRPEGLVLVACYGGYLFFMWPK